MLSLNVCVYVCMYACIYVGRSSAWFARLFVWVDGRGLELGLINKSVDANEKKDGGNDRKMQS